MFRWKQPRISVHWPGLSEDVSHGLLRFMFQSWSSEESDWRGHKGFLLCKCFGDGNWWAFRQTGCYMHLFNFTSNPNKSYCYFHFLDGETETERLSTSQRSYSWKDAESGCKLQSLAKARLPLGTTSCRYLDS